MSSSPSASRILFAFLVLILIFLYEHAMSITNRKTLSKASKAAFIFSYIVTLVQFCAAWVFSSFFHCVFLPVLCLLMLVLLFYTSAKMLQTCAVWSDSTVVFILNAKSSSLSFGQIKSTGLTLFCNFCWRQF